MQLTAKQAPQSSRDQRTESLNRVISMLLQGLALQNFCSDDEEFEAFQRKVRKLREEISKIDDEDTGLLVVGSSARAPDRGDAVELTPRQKEIQAAVSMISESLLSVARPPEAQSQALRESEYEVASARTTDEIMAAAARLSVCLESIRAQILRRNDAALLPSQSYAPSDIDSVTGLPDARQAMDALSAAWKHRKRYCAAVFGILRLDSINQRFGFQAGDESLRVVTQHLAEYFARDYLLFRWRGPCLLCVMEKKLPMPLIVAEVKRVAGMRLQQAMTMKNRDAIVAISMTCNVISLETESVDEVVTTIEQFIASLLAR
jgi:GGDEF domain-containing protein